MNSTALSLGSLMGLMPQEALPVAPCAKEAAKCSPSGRKSLEPHLPLQIVECHLTIMTTITTFVTIDMYISITTSIPITLTYCYY